MICKECPLKTGCLVCPFRRGYGYVIHCYSCGYHTVEPTSDLAEDAAREHEARDRYADTEIYRKSNRWIANYIRDRVTAPHEFYQDYTRETVKKVRP